MTRNDWTALGVTALYLIASVPLALSQSQEFVFYIVVMAVLVITVGLIHSRVRFHPATIWALSAWGLMHMAGGLVHVSDETGVLYNYWFIDGLLKYDQAVHAYGFGVTTWACWQAMCRRMHDTTPTLGALLIVVAAGMGFGAMNEVVEFAATLLVPETNVGGYMNTGWDLVANLAGATCAAVLIRLRLLPEAAPLSS